MGAGSFGVGDVANDRGASSLERFGGEFFVTNGNDLTTGCFNSGGEGFEIGFVAGDADKLHSCGGDFFANEIGFAGFGIKQRCVDIVFDVG